jgi:hypothetical protein
MTSWPRCKRAVRDLEQCAVAACAEACMMINTLMAKIARIAFARIKCAAGQADRERSQPLGLGGRGGGLGPLLRAVGVYAIARC